MSLPRHPLSVRARLGVERLETRATPASISLVNGNLTISNPRGAILVVQNAGGDFSVSDNGVAFGKYIVPNGITINGNNLDNQIGVSIAAGKLLPGNLTINGFNGNDTIVVVGNGTGRIGGNLNIYASNGNDLINIGRLPGGAASGIRIGGGGVISAGTGIDTVNVATSKFGASVNVTQANNFTLGIGGTAALINGDLTINNSADFAGPNTQLFGANSIVAGGFSYKGGTGNDGLVLLGTMCTVPGKHANIDTGEGNSTLAFNGVVGSFVTANLTFKGSNNPVTGSDSVAIGNLAAVSGNLTLNMQNGANFYDLDQNFFVGGNFNLSAGSDADDVGPIDGIINGDANINLGSGDDSIIFGTFNAGLGFVGGNITADLGDGDDLIDINIAVGSGPGTGQVLALLGAGADSFTACDPTFSAYGAATVDFGVDSDNDFGEVLFGVLSPFTTYLNVSGGDIISTC